MNIDKRIIILLVIIAILSVGVIWGLYTHQDRNDIETNNTTELNDTEVKNATMVESETSDSERGQYGYCAICGRALTYEEANDEYSQGKVCHDCAANPYYETPEGADYANKKLAEAYPDEYSWMNDNSSDSDDYEYKNDNEN